MQQLTNPYIRAVTDLREHLELLQAEYTQAALDFTGSDQPMARREVLRHLQEVLLKRFEVEMAIHDETFKEALRKADLERVNHIRDEARFRADWEAQKAGAGPVRMATQQAATFVREFVSNLFRGRMR